MISIEKSAREIANEIYLKKAEIYAQLAISEQATSALRNKFQEYSERYMEKVQ